MKKSISARNLSPLTSGTSCSPPITTSPPTYYHLSSCVLGPPRQCPIPRLELSLILRWSPLTSFSSSYVTCVLRTGCLFCHLVSPVFTYRPHDGWPFYMGCAEVASLTRPRDFSPSLTHPVIPACRKTRLLCRPERAVWPAKPDGPAFFPVSHRRCRPRP